MTTLTLNYEVDKFEAIQSLYSRPYRPTKDELISTLNAAYKRFIGNCTRESKPGMQADLVIMVSVLKQLI